MNYWDWTRQGKVANLSLLRHFFSPPANDEKSHIYLPDDKDIAAYLLLIRAPVIKSGVGEPDSEIVYEESDWQLHVTPTGDILSNKIITLPPFKEIASQELSAEERPEDL